MNKPPTNRQKEAVILWAMGDTAKEVGRALGISDRAVYKRLYRMKLRDHESYERMQGIRRSTIKQRTSFKRPMILDMHAMDTWSDDGYNTVLRHNGCGEQSRIIRKF